MMLKIMVMSGPDDGLELHLTPEVTMKTAENQQLALFTIGRRETCDICIPFDTSVSRLHASLVVNNIYNLLLIDEDSRNGTFVGRQRVKEPVGLDEGTIFRVGNTWLRVQALLKEDA